jgi:hypothetical protein
MNNLIIINLLKSFLLCIPFVLILLKDIVYFTLTGIQSHRETVFEKYKDQLFKQHNVYNEHDLPKKVFNEYYEKNHFVYYNSKLQKILNFIQDSLWIDSYNGIYEFYLAVSTVFLLAGVVSAIWRVDDYKDQKKLYESNYQVIRQYEDGNYKNLSNWKYDARSICERAESTNDKFFTNDGDPRQSWFKYIDPKNYDGLKPIDTNIMWTDYYKLCGVNDDKRTDK